MKTLYFKNYIIKVWLDWRNRVQIRIYKTYPNRKIFKKHKICSIFTYLTSHTPYEEQIKNEAIDMILDYEKIEHIKAYFNN